MTKVWPHQIKVVIFDCDGTLTDTEWAYGWVHEQLTGSKLTWDLRPLLMGVSAVETCAILIERYHLDVTVDELVKRRTALLQQCWHDIRLMPGADEITDRLTARGIPFCVATASRNFANKAATRPEFFAKFHHAITGNDIQRGKPNPDIFLLAASRWGDIAPAQALVFEDSPVGIKTANNAGMPSVFVPDPEMPDPRGSLAEADAVPTLTIKSLLDFDFDLFDWSI
jgi:pseudouridine-5'-monophosphatase